MAATSEANPRGAEAVTTSFVFLALSGLFTIVRIYGRVIIVKKPGIDDLLLVCSWASAAAFAALVNAQVQYGLGRHLAELPTGEITKMLKPLWASIVVYNVGLTVTKCSILCQFFRFFIDPKARAACWIALGTVTAYGICTMFGSIFACTPIAFYWGKNIPAGHCMNFTVFWFVHAAFNIVSDLVIIMLPIPVLITLSLPRRQKYGLILIFILGGFTCIVSILRLPSLSKMSKSTDLTYDNVAIALWTSIELNVGIICACLVSLKPVLAAIFPGLGYGNTSRKYSIELPVHGNPDVQRSADENKSTDIQRPTPSLSRQSTGRKAPWDEVEELWDSTEGRRENSNSKDYGYSWSVTTVCK